MSSFKKRMRTPQEELLEGILWLSMITFSMLGFLFALWDWVGTLPSPSPQELFFVIKMIIGSIVIGGAIGALIPLWRKTGSGKLYGIIVIVYLFWGLCLNQTLS
jgi:hypothetical protein